MIIKKKNNIVGIINIIFGILGCINWFICYNCLIIREKDYIDFSLGQYRMSTLWFIFIILTIIFTFIINFIYIFKNWHNKKSMILNFLTILVMVGSIILLAIFDIHECVYINAIIAIFGIILLIFNKNEEEGKKHRLLFSIMIINIVLCISSSIGFKCIENDYEIKYANNEKNLIKSIMRVSNANGISENKPIKAKKNGKWGIIDSNGNTIINFEYDDCSEYIEIKNRDNNKKYYIVQASIGNELKILTNKNIQIASFKNKKNTEKIKSAYIPLGLIENLQKNAEELNIKLSISKSQDNSQYKYYDSEKERKYNISVNDGGEDVKYFTIDNNTGTSSPLVYNTKTKSVTYNNRKVSIDGDLYFYKYNQNGFNGECINTYQNGCIPIYNFEKNIFGWIDTRGQAHYIKGKYQILDFNDNYIAVKDYSKKSDANVCVMDYDGKVVSDYYKEITVLDNGFVVKKINGKNVYIDESFKDRTQGYDIIDTSLANDGILIVSNLNRTTGNLEANLNNLRFDLINIKSGQIIDKDFEFINGMNNQKYRANYYKEITTDEFKKILCSVDCSYMNTDLYEKNYK